jgi:tRNA A37 threonylcarbamoyladenosine dehydratase
MADVASGAAGLSAAAQPDLGERRFGGLQRLYGEADYACLRALRVAVVGLGGVGSWTVEALARSGVARLVLVDFDHVAESNVNRQVQALGRTLGQAKGQALRERIADIHPGCDVQVVDEFASPGNWPGLLSGPVDAVVDACDQTLAKAAMAEWALGSGVPLVLTGAAGGKRRPERVEVGDLAEATHDPLLAALRQRLRRHGGAPRSGPIGLRCVYSREPVARPPAACLPNDAPAPVAASPAVAPLACAGYGSSVMVTATFGLVAAAQAVEAAVQRLHKARSA